VAEFAVILVHSTSHAISAERALRRAGLDVKLVPTPRHLSSDCGMAVKIPAENRDASRQTLEAGGVPFDRIEILDR
jgi:hypothetical protein